MIIKAKDEMGKFASFENRYLVEIDKQVGIVQKRIVVPNAIVPWSITELTMANIKITHAQSQIDKSLVLQIEQEEPTIDLFVQLRGQSQIRRSHQADRRYRDGQGNLVHVPASEGELRLDGPAISTFAVQFSVSFFRQFLDENAGCLDQLADSMDQGRMHSLTPHNSLVTPAMKAIAYDVLHCPFTGLIKRLYLEAKLLELLALQLEQGEVNQPGRTKALRPEDMEKLMAVSEWLNEHYLQPITLSEVARLVGLNDFKLKKGFRTLFNTTVFGYLTNLRMCHARRLLLDHQQTVAEASDTLGYQHIHHFSHAFRKHFGYLPSELRA